jgi:hypothetical protein
VWNVGLFGAPDAGKAETEDAREEELDVAPLFLRCAEYKEEEPALGGGGKEESYVGKLSACCCGDCLDAGIGRGRGEVGDAEKLEANVEGFQTAKACQ